MEWIDGIISEAMYQFMSDHEMFLYLFILGLILFIFRERIGC